MTNFNTEAFMTWLKSNGRCFNHMSTAEQREAIKEYKALRR
jgi:hypothetical protein